MSTNFIQQLEQTNLPFTTFSARSWKNSLKKARQQLGARRNIPLGSLTGKDIFTVVPEAEGNKPGAPLSLDASQGESSHSDDASSDLTVTADAASKRPSAEKQQARPDRATEHALERRPVPMAASMGRGPLTTATSLKSRAAMRIVQGRAFIKRTALTWIELACQAISVPPQQAAHASQRQQNSEALTRVAAQQTTALQVDQRSPALELQRSAGTYHGLSALFREGEDEEKVLTDGSHSLTAPLSAGENALMTHHAALRNRLEENIKASKQLANEHAVKKPVPPTKRLLHFKLLELINYASTKDCKFFLEVMKDDEELFFYNDALSECEKKGYRDLENDDDTVFDATSPFSINLLLHARFEKFSLRKKLVKKGLWPAPERKRKERPNLPLVAKASLKFGNSLKSIPEGIHMSYFKLVDEASPNRKMKFAATFEVRYEEILPTLVQRYPWTFGSQEDSDVYAKVVKASTEEPASEETLDAQQQCLQGDYLTIYTNHSKGYPTWKRYWAVAMEDQVVLYDFISKTKSKPIAVIPIERMLFIDKPSLDDCEMTGVSRCAGLVLQFSHDDEKDAYLQQDGKLFAYAESEQSAEQWRKALDSPSVPLFEDSDQVSIH